MLITGLPSNPTISARIDLLGPNHKPNCAGCTAGGLRNAALSPDGDTALVSTDPHDGSVSSLYVLRNIRAFARSKNPDDLQIRTFSDPNFPQLHSLVWAGFRPGWPPGALGCDQYRWASGATDGYCTKMRRATRRWSSQGWAAGQSGILQTSINVLTHSLGNIDLSLDGRTLLINDTTDFSGIPFTTTSGPKSDQVIVCAFGQGRTPRVTVVSTFSTPKGFPTIGPPPVRDARLTPDGRFILAPIDLISNITAQQKLTALNQIAILGLVRNGYHMDTIRSADRSRGRFRRSLYGRSPA